VWRFSPLPTAPAIICLCACEGGLRFGITVGAARWPCVGLSSGKSHGVVDKRSRTILGNVAVWPWCLQDDRFVHRRAVVLAQAREDAGVRPAPQIGIHLRALVRLAAACGGSSHPATTCCIPGSSTSRYASRFRSSDSAAASRRTGKQSVFDARQVDQILACSECSPN